MATTNRERVGLALDLLKAGLTPFVAREFINHCKGRTERELERILGVKGDPKRSFVRMDSHALLKLMVAAWHELFSKTLGRAERSLVGELQEYRNQWAHQEPFSTDDTVRVLDSIQRLLTAVSAGQASEVNQMRVELERVRYEEQARQQRRLTVREVVSPCARARAGGRGRGRAAAGQDARRRRTRPLVGLPPLPNLRTEEPQPGRPGV